jgi:hypothetical protein
MAQPLDIISELNQLRLASYLTPYLTITDYKTLRLVNKALNNIITTNYKTNLYIKLNNYNYNEEVSNIGKVGLLNDFIDKVSIEGLVKDSKLFSAIAEKFNNLQELNLIEVKFSGNSINFIHQLSGLKSLKLKNLSQVEDSSVVSDDRTALFNLNLPNLSRLSLEYSEKSKNCDKLKFPIFTGLRELVYLTIKLDKVNTIPDILSEVPQIENSEITTNSSKLRYLHLELEGNPNQLQYINQNLPTIHDLITLKLKSTKNADLILQHLNTCKSLEKLQLNLTSEFPQEPLFKIIFKNQRTLQDLQLNTEIQLEAYFNQLIFCDLIHLKNLSCYLKDQPSADILKKSLPNLVELNLPNTLLNLDLLPSAKNLVKLECLSLETEDLSNYPKLLWLKSNLVTRSFNDVIINTARLIDGSSWIWLRNSNNSLVEGSTSSSVIGIRISN